MLKKPQTPNIGIYQIFEVSSEIINGRLTYFADALYAEPSWKKFSPNSSTIRLTGLYNPSSIGPKEFYKPVDLLFCFIHILEKNVMVDPLDTTKTIYQMIWEVTKPDNYDQLVEERECLKADFLMMDNPHDTEFQEMADEFRFQDMHFGKIESAINGDFNIKESNEDDI